jgi:hypothetical protein
MLLHFRRSPAAGGGLASSAPSFLVSWIVSALIAMPSAGCGLGDEANPLSESGPIDKTAKSAATPAPVARLELRHGEFSVRCNTQRRPRKWTTLEAGRHAYYRFRQSQTGVCQIAIDTPPGSEISLRVALSNAPGQPHARRRAVARVRVLGGGPDARRHDLARFELSPNR